MARAYDLERADTARPGGQNDRKTREIERRRRNTAMGAGAGADFCDESLIPAAMVSIQIPAQDITGAFRMIRDTARSTDERIELLTIILGE